MTWPTVTVSPGLGEDLGRSCRPRARAPRRRPCRSRSRRSSRRPRPASPGCLGHSRIDALGDRLAHLRHDDVDGVSPAAASSAAGALGARGAVGGRGAVRARSRRARRRPSTVSPSAAWIFTTVPAAGAGTSASTLSVEISTRVSSSATVSPSCLCHSRMVPSETESPIAGMATSTVVLTAIAALRPYRVRPTACLVQRVALDHEADASGERADAAHDGDHHGRARAGSRRGAPRRCRAAT